MKSKLGGVKLVNIQLRGGGLLEALPGSKSTGGVHKERINDNEISFPQNVGQTNKNSSFVLLSHRQSQGTKPSHSGPHGCLTAPCRALQ